MDRIIYKFTPSKPYLP